MQSRWSFLPAAFLPILFAACSNGGSSLAGHHPSGTGPFDSRGNYVEAWADNPSQWRNTSRTQVSDAQPDRPAADVPVSTTVIAANTTPKPATTSATTVVYKKPATPAPTTAKPKPTPAPAVAKTTTPKPKPKPQPKPVAKPKTTRHIVKSGDNLYNIAKRYGTSVAAIQKANGIKGSVIRPGQSLAIPR